MDMRSLRDFGERALIQRISDILQERTGVPLMLDDAAIAPRHCTGCYTWVTTDPCPIPNLVQRLGIGNFYHAGWLLVVKSLSDLAAMGARPTGLLVSAEFPNDFNCSDFDAFFGGVVDCCSQHGTFFIGGNLKESSSGCHAVSCALGTTPSERALTRAAPSPGDVLFVVPKDELGGFWAGIALGLKMGDSSRLPDQVVTFAETLMLKPRAMIREGQELLDSNCITACMDNSDGLLASAIELVTRSHVDAIINIQRAALPDRVLMISDAVGADPRVWAIGWGSYHLLCAASRENVARAQERLEAIGSQLAVIGYAEEGSGRVVVNGTDLSGRAPAYILGNQFTDGSFWQVGPQKYVDAMMSRGLEKLLNVAC